MGNARLSNYHLNIIIFHFLSIQEPSVAQGTHDNSRRLLTLNRKHRLQLYIIIFLYLEGYLRRRIVWIAWKILLTLQTGKLPCMMNSQYPLQMPHYPQLLRQIITSLYDELSIPFIDASLPPTPKVEYITPLYNELSIPFIDASLPPTPKVDYNSLV